MTAQYAILPTRGVLAVDGPDARAFLQALISNDVTKVTPERAVHAALLTPQGKYLHDFFVLDGGDGLLLECERERLADLVSRLTRYRLRAKVVLRDVSAERAVVAAFGDAVLDRLGLPAEVGAAQPLGSGIVYVDPRLSAAGARALLLAGEAAAVLAERGFTPASAEAYDRHRLSLGLADGSRDIDVEKSFLLECGFDELHGIDYQKGCYVGQELTARTHYRGAVRRRLLPVRIEGPVPPRGAALHLDEAEVGEMRSAQDGVGLVLIRLDRLNEARQRPLRSGESRLMVQTPGWLALPPA